MRISITGLAVLLMSVSVSASDLAIEARIEQAMLDSHRSQSNQQRNRYRHPVGTLSFLGLHDGMTVLEIWPGGGWYTEILAPVLKHHGQYLVASYDMDIAEQPAYRFGLHKDLLEKFAVDPGVYDQVAVIPFSPPESPSLGAAESVDMVLTFRNVHGWISDGISEIVFAEFARVLRPGGVLGLVQHRAANGTDALKTAENGYVSEQAVVNLAAAVGLYLEARSEVNANSADSGDHPEGVWSLPPGYAACKEIEPETERQECMHDYGAIGESDRMTLRFRKPIN
jgi:predicted methyltransferase